MQFAKWIESVGRSVCVDLLKCAHTRRRFRRPAPFPNPIDRLEQRLVMSVFPSVVSLNRSGPISSSGTAGYALTFNEAVTGVAASDFKVITDGTAAFTAPVVVSGTGSSYTVNVNGVHGNGNLTLELVDNDTIIDSGSNPLGGPGVGNGSFIGQTYSVLQAFPAVQSINRNTPAGPLAPDGSVTFTATFTKPVTGVDATAFVAVSTGTVAVAGPITASGSGAVYSVTVNGITGAGTLGLNLVDNGKIHDLAGNPLQNSPTTSAPFQPPIDIGPGPRPGAIAVADMNGDGIPDIIEVYGTTLGIMLGNGNGTFQALQTVSTAPLGATAIAVADMNGDGNLDVVVVNGLTNRLGSVGILLGNGNGTLKAEQTYAVGTYPVALSVADLNGDGKEDVVVANNEGSGTVPSVSVLLGNGDGTLQSQLTDAVGASPRGVVVADVNGDGNPDIITANGGFGQGISVLLGNGNGTFFQLPQHTFATGNPPYSLALADVNGDGIPDVVTASSLYTTMDVLLGNGNGTFKAPAARSTSGYPDAIVMADVNGDGSPDILVANTTTPVAPGGIGVLLSNGNGTFQSEQIVFAYSYLSTFTVADINGDGRADLVTNGGPRFTTTASILLNNGTGGFTGQTYTISPLATSDTINGTPGNDTITLVQDASATNIDWTMGASSGTLPINDPNGLTINGNGGSDTIILDYTHGNPLPNIMHLNSDPSAGGTFTFNYNGLSGSTPLSLANTTIDLEKSKIFLTYGTIPNPISSVVGWLTTGYNAGAWNGSGAGNNGAINSSAAATNGGYMIGYADSADGVVAGQPVNTVELMYTLGGDLNLAATVNFNDFAKVVADYGQAAPWDGGAITYGATVSFNDFALTVSNYGKQANLSAAPPGAVAPAAARTAASTFSASTVQGSTTAPTSPPQTTAASSAVSSASVTSGKLTSTTKHKHHRHGGRK